MKKATTEVKKERNLIQAVKLLRKVNAQLIPLQIRLSKNKLFLVFDIIKKSPIAWKHPDLLCQFLNFASSKKDKLSNYHIYEKTATKAFELKYFQESYNQIKFLMKEGYVNIAPLCIQLVKSKEFYGNSQKMDLISFTLATTPDLDIVPELFQMWKELRKENSDRSFVPLFSDDLFYYPEKRTETRVKKEVEKEIIKSADFENLKNPDLYELIVNQHTRSLLRKLIITHQYKSFLTFCFEKKHSELPKLITMLYKEGYADHAAAVFVKYKGISRKSGMLFSQDSALHFLLHFLQTK